MLSVAFPMTPPSNLLGTLSNPPSMLLVLLPEVLSSCDPDWVTDELRNLSQKKSNAWLSYHNAAKRGYEVKNHREEYKLFCKLTKEAAEKARNAWWTARAVEAEGMLGWLSNLVMVVP